ncbi:TonB-dependent siderophore receptor [Mesorhizobium sp. M7A.F.Ca.US.014.04.1.1]|nr:TonB-dependent receptor [Mesorhizobium ciceri]RUU18607.1 TonB-dependent siderophore receptor [Mesorhizobium sp. Primo-B]RUU38761.1 TonB-dependent siderophore receptor [Mesorhizobium sp. Primo-A]RUX14373.1 TonB-dependent siderophore receptor [Mesorhizobium sp. M7A.F.Ca.CA.002.14.1.2]RUX37558.1 TonB-dependent siderophore receptor [Mesorhizobium sp. M7A.F.Ca.CA.002.11.2.1]RUX48860.1 TonB-dependent siderophore receptor [Mesorhizobium sp. M7A.F.Ca.CA.002.09.1.1]RUX61141.1 TonB-dependent siderop
MISGRGLIWQDRMARKRLLIAAVSVPALLGCGHALAQETVTTTLDPINVQERVESAFGPVKGYVATKGSTGTKTDTPLIETPQSISVITKDQMEAQAIDNLGGVLRYTPGATGDLYGTDNRGLGLQLRGISNANGVFYRDGLQLKESNFILFTALDSYGAERYEVLRGPASVLYGQASPGGIINYVSKRPTEENLREIELGGGSFNRYEGKFDFSGAVNADKSLLFRLTGAAHMGDTQTDFVKDDRIFIAPAITWQPDADTSLTILANYQRDRSGWAMQYLPAYGTVIPGKDGKYLPNSMFVGEPGFDSYNNDQASIGYEFDHRFNETWQVRQHARYVHLTHTEEGVFGGGLTDSNGLEPSSGDYYRYADAGGTKLSGVTIDNQAQADFDTGPLAHTLLVGLDYKRYTYRDYASEGTVEDGFNIFDPVYGYPITDLTPYTDTDTTQQQVGLYAQDQVKFGNWRLTLGGRQDWSDAKVYDNLAGGYIPEQKDNAFTSRAGLVYLADNGLAPYVSYSESFQPVAGADSDGNLFVPETSRQYEIGLKYQPTGWNSFITASVFDLTRQNVVRSGNEGSPNDLFQTGEIRSRGVEFEAVASLDSGFDLRAAYTYLDTKITRATAVEDVNGVWVSNEGNTPFGVPAHSASLWANYTFMGGKLEGLGLGAGVRYVGSTYGDDANSFKVPSVVLADAAVHYAWQNATLSLNASNLFDKRYVASCFSSGFGCFYGEGRRINGSVKYTW